MKDGIVLIILGSLLYPSILFAGTSEVLPPTDASVVVREHPRTGEPYISIVDPKNPEARNPLSGMDQEGSPPDYRMLEPHAKSGDIPYDGPVSDRKKVYILAASLATLGATGGLAAQAAVVPATAATGSAAGGAGIYAAAGTAVSAGTVSAAWLKTRPDPEKDNLVLQSGTRVKRLETGREEAMGDVHQ